MLRLAILMAATTVPVVAAVSFVPTSTPLPVISYWTTWYVQNYPDMVPIGGNAMGDAQLFANDNSTVVQGGGAEGAAAGVACPKCLGWADNFYPEARQDLLMVLDDTWFVRPSNFANQWQLVGPGQVPERNDRAECIVNS